jgi:hypothetical protein
MNDNYYFPGRLINEYSRYQMIIVSVQHNNCQYISSFFLQVDTELKETYLL